MLYLSHIRVPVCVRIWICVLLLLQYLWFVENYALGNKFYQKNGTTSISSIELKK